MLQQQKTPGRWHRWPIIAKYAERVKCRAITSVIPITRPAVSGSPTSSAFMRWSTASPARCMCARVVCVAAAFSVPCNAVYTPKKPSEFFRKVFLFSLKTGHFFPIFSKHYLCKQQKGESLRIPLLFDRNCLI